MVHALHVTSCLPENACCEFLEKNMDAKNAVGIYFYAEAHACMEMAETAKSFALRHLSTVCQEEEFLDLSQAELIELITDGHQHITVYQDEGVLFDAVMCWLDKDPDARSNDFHRVLEKMVKLPLLSLGFLKDAVDKHPILTDSDQCRRLVEEMKAALQAVISKLHQHRLKFDAGPFVGLGPNSTALLGRMDSNSLSLLRYEDGGYITVWDKPLPAGGASVNDYKYILPNTNIALRDWDGDPPTSLYSPNLAPLHKHRGDYGHLLGVLPSGQLVYAKKVPRGQYEVVTYSSDSQHQQMMRLQPPEGHTWGRNISVCGRPHAEWVVVVDSRSMDIFAGGEHRHHWDLSYEPYPYNAVTATVDHIIVAQHDCPTSLHVFCTV